MRRALLVFVIAGFAAAGSWAADKASAPKAAASRPAKVPILTPAQLRDCENQKSALRTQNDAYVKAKEGIDAEAASIQRRNAELDDELAKTDRTSQPAVDAYMAKVNDFNEASKALQARVADYNAMAPKQKALKDNYEKTCETRRYDDRDLADIKRGKQK